MSSKNDKSIVIIVFVNRLAAKINRGTFISNSNIDLIDQIDNFFRLCFI
jgi:hypothetical protein